MNPGRKWEMTPHLPTAIMANVARPPCSAVGQMPAQATVLSFRSNASPGHREAVFRMRLTFRSSIKANQLHSSNQLKPIRVRRRSPEEEGILLQMAPRRTCSAVSSLGPQPAGQSCRFQSCQPPEPHEPVH